MMKKILFILFLFCCFSAKAQWNPNDTTNTTKYTQYKYWYGIRVPRVQPDSVLGTPIDTIFSKNGLATIGTKLFVGNGAYWTEKGSGGGSTDTTSLSNRINQKLNISDTANIRARLVEGNGIVITGSYPNLTIKVDSAAYKTVFDALQDSTALATAITAKGKLDSVSVVNDSTINIIRKDGTSYNLVIKGGTGAGGSGSSRVNILAYPLRSDSISPDTSRIYIRQSWQDSALAGISLYNTFLVSTGEIILDTATRTVTVMDNIIFYENGIRDSITSPFSKIIPSAGTGMYQTTYFFIDNTGSADTVRGPISDDVNVHPALPSGGILFAIATTFEDSVISATTVNTFQRTAIMYIDPGTGQPITDSLNNSYDNITKSITVSGAFISNILGDVAFKLKGGSSVRAYESASNGRLYLDGAASNTSSYVIQRTGSSFQNNNALMPSGNFIVGWDGIPASEVSSAKFAIISNSKGFLPPKLTGSEQAGITGPVSGLMIYNTDSSALCYYNGSAWVKIGGSGAGGSTPSLQQVTSVNYKTTTGLWASYGVFGDTTQTLNVSDGNLIVGEAVSSGIINNNTGAGNIIAGRATGASSEILADDIGGVAVGLASSGGKIKSTGGSGALAIGLSSSGGVIQADDAGSLAIGVANSDSLFTTGAGSIVVGKDNVNETDYSYLFGNGLRNYGFTDDDRAFKIGWDATETFVVKKDTLRFTDGTQGNGKVLTSDANGNATWQTPSGGSTTPQYFDMIGSGASNMSGRDTSWKALTVTTFPNVQSFNASNTFVTANPNTNNICFSDATTTATRNNTAWQFGIARWKENLTDTVRMVVDAVGGTGSWEWTPQTTGVGEVTTSNTRLTSLITKLDATPLNFKAKVILMQYGETDATSANVQFLDTNIIKFYDTIVKHRAVDTAATMILCYPISNQPINGDSLRMSLDSIYYGIRRMGNRNIIVVPHYYPGTASGHPSNDSTTAIAKRAYSNYKQGIANGPKMPDTALWKKNTSPIFTYTPTKVVVNAASQINSSYPLNVVNTGTSELAIFGRSDNSRSIKLFATSTAGYLMYNNATDKIGVRTNDSSWSVSDSNQTTLGLLVGYNSVQISKPLTITSNSTQSGVAVFTGATTPLRVFNTTTSGGQLELAANASAAGNYTSVKFRQGSLGTFTGGEIKSILNSGASGSHMTFETNKGAGGVETIRLTDSNKVGIGVTSITALLHLKAGTATAWTAPLKFTSGTNLTTPESGAVEFDGTNYFGTASTTRYTFAKTLTATATLDFGSTAAGGVSDLTITVTGAADGDAVSLGVPNGSIVASGNFTAWVSATNTVTVRYSNNDLTTARDPASGTFRVSVVKY